MALAVLAAMASTADAGSAVAWLQGADTNAPSSAPRRDGGARARASEPDDLRARIVPEARAQVDMRDLQEARDAADRAAAADRAGADDASGVAKQRQASVESAGGGLDFRAGPPAADTEDIARRVRASKGEVILLHGGLADGGDSARHTAVLAGLGAPEGAVFCRLAAEDGAGTASLASAGAAASPADDRAFFHGGYRVWDGGNDFADADDLAVFDGKRSGWACVGEACGDDENAKLGARATKKASSSKKSTSKSTRSSSKPPPASASPGRRDEHVAVVTPHPIELGGVKQRALVVFGGRDESDARLDSVFALGLDDGEWRELRPKPPSLKKGARAAQGPFDLPAVIRAAHEDTRAPYALARSGASAVVTDDNVMFIFGGFVVEGRLGFNVGELLALDLNANAFFYPEVSGDLPVRRNKHTAVLDAQNRMWVWGGSVWDHTGGSATYASTATHVADLSDPRRVVWRAAETKGSPPSQRRLHASVIKDGVMYVIGGEDYHSKRFLQDVHALDLETLTWSQPATAGSAGGGRIRAAAVGLRVADGAALEGCGEGTPSPAVTGELQPRNDKLVTALQESAAAVGKKKKRGKGEKRDDVYDELFAAMLGTRSVVGDASAIRAGWVPEARRGALSAADEDELGFVGDLGSGLLVESRGMWELHLLADVPDVGLLELQADDLPEFQFQGRAAAAEEKPREAERDPRDPKHLFSKDAEGWALEAGRGGRRPAFRTETEAVVARAGANGRHQREAGAETPESAEEEQETFEEALDDLLDDFPSGAKKKKGEEEREKKAVVARGDDERKAESRGTRRSSERRADEALDDVPSGAKKKKNEEEREKKAVVARQSSDEALPGSSEEAASRAAAETREAHRVARRDAAAVRAGGTVESRFADSEDSDPIDPRSVAASADRSYLEIVEHDKREAARASRLGAVSEKASRRETGDAFANEEGTSFSFAFDDSGRVTRVRASLGDARDDVAAEAETETPETPETPEENVSDDASELTGSEIVVDATTLGAEEYREAFRDASRGEQALALARLGDAGSLDPTDPDSEDYVAQMGSSPADTRKLWAQFKAHLEKFETAKDARAGGGAAPGLGAEGPRNAREASEFRAFAETRGGEARARTREDVDGHDARVSAAAAEATRELVEASLGARERRGDARAVDNSRALSSASQSSAVLRVLGGAAVLATVGVFGMSKLATRLRLEHAAALGTKDERARLSVPDPECFRGATPLAPRESPKTTTATWQSAAAARWRSHFEDAGSDDSVVDVYE